MACGPKEEWPFEVHNPGVAKLFAEGSAVLYVTEIPPGTPSGAAALPVAHPEGIPKGMVISRENYEKILYAHDYLPILYVSPLHMRVAYLYECLNLSLHSPRKNTHVVWWRHIGATQWDKWFSVHPYKDTAYDPELDPVFR